MVAGKVAIASARRRAVRVGKKGFKWEAVPALAVRVPGAAESATPERATTTGFLSVFCGRSHLE